MNDVAPWSMTEDGEWILNEPYASMVDEAKQRAAAAWQAEICEYLSSRTNYTTEDLISEFIRRSVTTSGEESKYKIVGMVDSFIIEALEGSL